ncbi:MULTISPECIES: NAD(P)H-hydrate dehydratase [unclassified Undibacterium]|uniref:NAD(P)H-hydrate dehydratase n=1 Tax=unclassified Undibacterium TaxID=2630295 RepID=UPI002AC90D75|nr:MULTISPECIES: NAD(P)H-hydrate dehydratase [unclassified Undibacterium]MEB0139868.1 NAD(P)H-hydrate dehydratase [Undibacterium sp. CCC2.1]MEB0172798.1 NAD(P)H-hydrate dehydratase [Undibacterium sp. CCC1.1]MEB0176590.1 NAD(P)H-hydrate dehydratase [Undibacterium sp. CCC3.4]MEB0215820.1 NAD(P)H-hydrate dehydratase [Undibacterium sp. 5I2]WPX42671.1 NAD(P)H-hydrate dehydratase [Undibacterium sp. CCC3.4]
MPISPRAALDLYSVASIRTLESAALASGAALMPAAGQAAADFAITLLGQPARKVLLLAGPGNNGGDACACAAILAQAGWQVSLLLYADDDYAAAKNARQALAQARSTGATIARPEQLTQLLQQDWDLIIDGLFGIGLARALSGPYRSLVEHINAHTATHRLPLLALDVPSGLDADSGCVISDDADDTGIAIRADHTLTFITDKAGLHTAAGKDYAGHVSLADLAVARTDQAHSESVLNCPLSFDFDLPTRRHNSHKGSYGDVLIIGGSVGMVGAAILAARAALYGGAGRVMLGLPEGGISYDLAYPEIMCRDLRSHVFGREIVVIGPGLGQTPAAADWLTRALESDCRLVIDADALNLLATQAPLQARLRARRSATVLTPHPLEAARLLQCNAAAIQGARLPSAAKLAADWHCTVVLKGTGSIIASPNTQLAINTTGNPGLASGGSGDVLAGLVGALLAQGMDGDAAARLAVWLHGAAADQLVADGDGPIGLHAGELASAIRRQLNLLVSATLNRPNY